MKVEETIYDVQKRFTHIVNHLIPLGKVLEKEELTIKILKSLNRAWQPKVTAISESRDLTTMSMATLFGKLREHELELGRLKEEEEGEKKQSIALKAAAKTEGRSKANKDKETADHEDEDSDSETLNLMVKRFSKFLKYKNKSNAKSAAAGNRRFPSKRQESSSNTPTCYECGKSGHIKPECPILKIKKKLEEKSEATRKSKRVKKTYIAWEDNDSSTSSDSSESNEEETNMCLMADTKSFASSVSDLESTDESYETRFYQLLDVYNELHEEARKLQYSNNRHKGENRWLENRLKQLETENEELKTELENIEKHKSCNCKKSVINCENCSKQLERIKYLMSTLTRFTLGRNYLDAMLGSHRSVLNREGIGYAEHENQLGSQLESRKFINI